MKAKACLSVIIPCYNEENTIKELVDRVREQELVGEIIIIDDASTDSSASVIEGINHPNLVFVRNVANSGKGFSVGQGIKLASKPYLLIQDADLEYSPSEYDKMFAPIQMYGADAVFGSRFLSSSNRRVLYFRHKLGNNLLTFLSNLCTDIDLTDMETCYKLIRTDIAKLLHIQENRFGIEPEITAKLASLKLKIYEVPISYNGRTYADGKKITWRDGFSAIRCIFKYSSSNERKKVRERYLQVF
jgi:glycosyltransferase involved in cell wall biosynthesis